MSKHDLRKASGSMKTDSKLISFLYELMRDEVTPGRVEEILQKSLFEDGTIELSNGWLGKYAGYVASKLI